MTREEILNFEKVSTQLQSFHDETAILVKKDPNGQMNAFKLKLINKVIAKANEILGKKKPFEDFSEFDIEALPNNGDVSMIIGQYINCLEDLRKDNAHLHYGSWYWNIDGDEDNNEIRSYIPERYRK